MKNYAKEVQRLNEMSKEGVKRAVIQGERGCVHTFAIGHVGWVMGEREQDGVKQLKIFTGTRIWFIPEDQCLIVEEKKKKGEG